MLEFDGAAAARRGFGLIQGWRDSEPAKQNIVDVVPGERTVLVIASFDPSGQQALRSLRRWLTDVEGNATDSSAHPDTAEIELTLRYDGPDLADVAALTGSSVDEIIRKHSGTVFTVAFTGFAPGFAYLAGLPPELTVPRRSAPRTRVESGAVGLAGPYSGVYPRPSPGGWQIIGHLADENAPLWDPHRDPPALLQPGTRVRFRAADTQAPEPNARTAASTEATEPNAHETTDAKASRSNTSSVTDTESPRRDR